MSLTLLITAAGTGTGFSYAQAKARWFPEIKLLTGDIYSKEQITASLFAEHHFCLPPCNAIDYFPALRGLLHEWSVDAYIPLIDAEVVQAATQRATLPARVACNNTEFCLAASAKSRYAQWLDLPGITAPKPLKDNEMGNGIRIIAKRDGGFGGRATRIIETIDEANRLQRDGWSLYPYVDGEEFTVDCFPLEDQVITSIRQRLEVKSGVCTKARISKDDTLTKLAIYLCKRFALNEPFCFQTRKTEDIHHLIDINPRLGAGTAMSALNGTDFFAAHLARLSRHEPLEFLQPRFEQCVVTRQYGEYLMSASL